MDPPSKRWRSFLKLTENYKGLQIAGMYSPPFRPMTEEEDEAVVKMINDTYLHFVRIGLCAPKQEKCRLPAKNLTAVNLRIEGALDVFSKYYRTRL